MKRFLFILLFGSPALAFPSEPTPEQQARAALALAAASAGERTSSVPCAECGPACDCSPCRCTTADAGLAGYGYNASYAWALQLNKPLIVWVNQPMHLVPGTVGCVKSSYPGMDRPGVVLGVPDGKGGFDEAGRWEGSPAVGVIVNRWQEWRNVQSSRTMAVREMPFILRQPMRMGGGSCGPRG